MTDRFLTRYSWTIPTGLFLLAVVPPWLVAALGRFDGLYGQDSFAYYDYAVGPLSESLARLKLPPPFFWPLGYPLLIVAVSSVLGRTPAAGQAVALVAGGLIPVLTFFLARELLHRGWRVATFAGLLVACTGQLWQSSMVVMSDTPALAAATLSAWGLARYGQSGRLRWLVLAAVALATAILIRWAYALLVLPWGLFLILRSIEHRTWRAAITHALIAAGVGAVLLVPELALAAVDFAHSGGTSAVHAGDLQVYSWNPLNAFRRSFDTPDGHLSYRLPNGLYFALAPAHWVFFTPLLALLIPIGLRALARQRAWMALALVAGWPAVIYTFHAGASWQNFRFTLAYLPPMAILAAASFLFRVSGSELGLIRPSRPETRNRKLVTLFLLGLVVMGVAGVQLCQGFIMRKNADLQTVRWVEAQVPAGSTLLAFNLTLTFRHYSQLETRELFEQTPATLQALLAPGRPAYLLVDVQSMATQWRNRSPGLNYRWLHDGPGLVPLGERSGYTLFQVRAGK